MYTHHTFRLSVLYRSSNAVVEFRMLLRCFCVDGDIFEDAPFFYTDKKDAFFSKDLDACGLGLRKIYPPVQNTHSEIYSICKILTPLLRYPTEAST